MSRKFLIFSGHNDRAAIALCRYFDENGLDFVVAARPEADAIRNSRYRTRIVFTRQTLAVDLQLFANISRAVGGADLIYCPTTEFINLFLLENRQEAEALGYILPLPDAGLYLEITNKKSAGDFFQSVPGITVPQEIAMDQATAPCVLKPRENKRDGKILYPRICRNDVELEQARPSHDPTVYFAQKYVEGASLYLCGCIDCNGVFDCFWQRNLGQQPNGKSIVLAREESEVPDDLFDLQAALLTRLKQAGYFGPFMVEIKRNGKTNYFVELNPRFWGPLQLSLDVCPGILERFVQLSLPQFESSSSRKTDNPCYYAWKGGMAEWDALESALDVNEAIARQDAWDVFERKDYADARLS